MKKHNKLKAINDEGWAPVPLASTGVLPLILALTVFYFRIERQTDQQFQKEKRLSWASPWTVQRAAVIKRASKRVEYNKSETGTVGKTIFLVNIQSFLEYLLSLGFLL